MLKNHFTQGQRDALAKFKLANLAAGAQGYNPTLNGQSAPAPTQAPSPSTPPTSVAAPAATGAVKSQVLG